MACWIVLLMPQLIEQWRLKSAEGIAIGFISIWFLGDVFNLTGAFLAHLLPEVVFLAVWFCFADFLMIFSYVYYTYIYKKHHHPHHDRSRSSNSLSPNNSHHHPHHHHHQLEHDAADENEALLRRRSSTITNIALEPSNHSIWTRYVLPIFFVVAAGAMGYFVSTPSSQSSPPNGELPAPIDDGGVNVLAQIFGYLSAILYLGARIPQIIQNYQRKSVYGLSLLFFLFLTLGNLTYAGQILFYRSDSKYILLNLSWLLGSLGTIFEDCIIFAQFYVYGDNEGKEVDDHEAIIG